MVDRYDIQLFRATGVLDPDVCAGRFWVGGGVCPILVRRRRLTAAHRAKIKAPAGDGWHIKIGNNRIITDISFEKEIIKMQNVLIIMIGTSLHNFTIGNYDNRPT